MPTDLEQLLKRQHGVITRAQAAAHGISRHGVANRLSSGRWQRVHPGVLATTTGQLDIDQRIWAAVSYAGEGATVGFRTAWWLADRKLPKPAQIDVVIPDPRIVVARRGIVVRRTRRWDPADLQLSAQPPRFRLERAALDCASVAATADDAIALLASAVQRRTTTVPRLREVLRRNRNLRRHALLGQVLDLAAEGAETLLEVRHHDVTTAHGLPAPDRQRHLGNAVVDGLYECPDGSLLVAELDGKLGHLDAEGWWADMHRDNRHTVERLGVLRFPGHLLLTRPHEVAATIAAALTARGWTGTLRCPRGCPGSTAAAAA